MKKAYSILSLLFCFLLTLSTSNSFANAKKVAKKVIICIDPGHGGKDPGKPKGDTKKHEKDLNLIIALKLGGYLETLPNVKVIYTRKTDVFVSLEDRVKIANKQKANYFISLHCNSNPSGVIRGTKTHIHSHKFTTSKNLALRIEKEFKTRGGRHSRGIMSARDRGYNLYVLQYTDMPSVLCEVGFMTNKNEAIYLSSTRGQDLIASAIFRAVRDFISKKQKSESRSKVYKVQLMASKSQMDIKTKKLKDLGLQVVEHKSNGSYKYKYMVGREYDMTGAQKLLKEVKKAGFKDAFIVSMSNLESKKFRIVEDTK